MKFKFNWIAFWTAFITTIILGTGKANAYNEKACSIFSNEQIHVMQDALIAGTPHNYGWTLAAIAWQESSAGDQLVNWADPSFGVFAINIKYAAKRYNAKTSLEQLELANRLVYDFEFSVEAAVAELDYWNKIHKGNWRKMWQSYNGGFSGSSASKRYSDDIAKKIRFLQVNGCLIDDRKYVEYISKLGE